MGRLSPEVCRGIVHGNAVELRDWERHGNTSPPAFGISFTDERS